MSICILLYYVLCRHHIFKRTQSTPIIIRFMVMPNSTLIVHNVQKRYGLRAQEIMVEIIRGSEVSKDSINNENMLQRARSIFLFQ